MFLRGWIVGPVRAAMRVFGVDIDVHVFTGGMGCCLVFEVVWGGA